MVKEAEALLERLDRLGIALPERADRQDRIRDLGRRSDWDTVEAQAKEFLTYIQEAGRAPFRAKRGELAQWAKGFQQFGVPLPAPTATLAEAVAADPEPEPWTAALGATVDLDEGLHAVENEFSRQARERSQALARWVDEPADRLSGLDGKVRAALEPVREGRVEAALGDVARLLRAELPAAVERHDRIVGVGRSLIEVARELGVPFGPLEKSITADAEAHPTQWPATVPAVEAASVEVASAMRERVGQALQSLRGTLESLRDYGVDPTAAMVTIEESLGALPEAGPDGLPGLLERAREATESPVVSVVASLLDEARPRLVEARQLGRDSSEVFAAMNRAREALRLRIYSEALSAAQEALERVNQLTSDLESLRDEAEALGELLGRLRGAGFSTGEYEAGFQRLRGLLESVQITAGRSELDQLVRELGEASYGFFDRRRTQVESLTETARERGFVPAEADGELAAARQALAEGDVAGAGERLSRLEVALRLAAGPYVSRQVEEMERGFAELPDPSLAASVRRHLADADVSLRVKEDLTGSLDSLRRAEREFSAVFAAHASALVEELEEERRTLESMGGTGDELQRQIDEVQQIFNMGEFVKASRASQEIRARARQQQLVRAEETVSHAKLALIELSKMGLEIGTLRERLEVAQAHLKDSALVQAWTVAGEIESQAGKTKALAQRVLDAIGQITERWQALERAGVEVDQERQQLAEARSEYQALDFEGALATVGAVERRLAEAQAAGEVTRLRAEIGLLLEDARRLGLPTGRFESAVSGMGANGEGKPASALLERAEPLHTSLVSELRPVLEENLRGVERDLEVASGAGVDAAPVEALLSEARRRLTQPVPTGVAEKVEEARARLAETRGFLEHAERAARRAREALSQAELVHVAAGPYRTRLEGIERELSQRRYAEVIDQAATLERELHQTTRQHVDRALAGFHGLIARARQAGTNPTLAENLLAQAREAMDDGRPLESLQLAARSEQELERVELQLQIARESMSVLERSLDRAHRSGVVTPAADSEAQRAHDAFEHHDYPQALELIFDASDLIAVGTEGHRRARDALGLAEAEVGAARETGAEAAEAVGVLDSARAEYRAGEYGKAIRTAREAVERARWAAERQYAGALLEVRHLIEVAEGAGASGEGAAAARVHADGAEAALKSQAWESARSELSAGRAAALGLLDALVEARLAELQAAGAGGEEIAGEPARRKEFDDRIAAARSRGDYPGIFRDGAEELERRKILRTQGLGRRLAQFKEEVLVGEKLGLDTTPVMELLSEAKLSLEAGHPEPVPGLIERGTQELSELVRGRLTERRRSLKTEVLFAESGLHVQLGPVPGLLLKLDETESHGEVIAAARILLEAEEDLNRRKSLHRELLNLHYLIDAALAKAAERHLDTSDVLRLLEESIRLRATDYARALEKARAALQHLQGQLRAVEMPVSTGFWPFRRPPQGQ